MAHRVEMGGQPWRGLALATTLLACSACADSGPGTTEGTDDAALVAWGFTGVEYQADLDASLYGRVLDNGVLLGNVVAALAGQTAGTARLLYTGCDPRPDPRQCDLGDVDVAPFLEVMASVGTVEFGSPTAFDDLAEFDVVIADFCFAPYALAETLDVLREYYDGGGHVLVLADDFCFLRDPIRPDNPSLARSTGDIANDFVEPLGVRFLQGSPSRPDPFTVPTGERTGLLAGVRELDLHSVAPVEITGAQAEPIVETPFGTMGAVVRRSSP